jgi:hypothetical protein
MADQTSRLTQPIQPHYAGYPTPLSPLPATFDQAVAKLHHDVAELVPDS